MANASQIMDDISRITREYRKENWLTRLVFGWYYQRQTTRMSEELLRELSNLDIASDNSRVLRALEVFLKDLPAGALPDGVLVQLNQVKSGLQSYHDLKDVFNPSIS